MTPSAWQYFTPAEFACRHCGACQMDDAFVAELDALRQACGFALTVTSGYRCPTHNSQVSTTGADGPHTTGMAVDILANGERAGVVLRHALALGFTGIGVYQSGPWAQRRYHLDSLPRGRLTIWSGV